MKEMFWAFAGLGLAFALPLFGIAAISNCQQSEPQCAEFALLPGESCGADQTLEVVRMQTPEGWQDRMVCRCKVKGGAR